MSLREELRNLVAAVGLCAVTQAWFTDTAIPAMIAAAQLGNTSVVVDKTGAGVDTDCLAKLAAREELGMSIVLEDVTFDWS